MVQWWRHGAGERYARERRKVTTTWMCPRCERRFTRLNQRHACGTGDGTDVLRNRPPELIATYRALEDFVKSLSEVELIARDRYVLFRTTRIFADVVIMAEAVRLAIHLPRKVQVTGELFVKVTGDRRHVTHVALLRSPKQVDAMKAFLREAHDFSIA